MALLILQLGDSLAKSGVFNVAGNFVLVGLTVLFVSLFSGIDAAENMDQCKRHAGNQIVHVI